MAEKLIFLFTALCCCNDRIKFCWLQLLRLLKLAELGEVMASNFTHGLYFLLHNISTNNYQKMAVRCSLIALVIASWEKKHTEDSGTQQHLYFKMADSLQAHGSVCTWRKRHFRYIPQSPYKMHRLSNPELLRPLEIVDWLNFMQVREAKYIKLAAYVLYMFSSKTKGRASAYGHNRLEQQHRL